MLSDAHRLANSKQISAQGRSGARLRKPGGGHLSSATVGAKGQTLCPEAEHASDGVSDEVLQNSMHPQWHAV